LLNLAKHPASTVQILGAEKALFRALKTKHETPKYGLIYHASLVGQTAPKYKGKISRVLAAKASLAARFDSFGEGETSTELGTESRAKVEARLQALEGGASHRISGTGKGKAKIEKYDSKKDENNQPRSTGTYNAAADSTMAVESEEKPKKEEKPAADELDLFGDDTEDEAREREIMKTAAEHIAKKKAAGKVVIAKSLVVLDVKPWDDTTDMKEMEEKVRSIELEGLEWKASKLVAIGYGIKKLQISCNIVDDLVSVDDIQEKIQEFEDLVQSTDVSSFSKL